NSNKKSFVNSLPPSAYKKLTSCNEFSSSLASLLPPKNTLLNVDKTNIPITVQATIIPIFLDVNPLGLLCFKRFFCSFFSFSSSDCFVLTFLAFCNIFLINTNIFFFLGFLCFYRFFCSFFSFSASDCFVKTFLAFWNRFLKNPILSFLLGT